MCGSSSGAAPNQSSIPLTVPPRHRAEHETFFESISRSFQTQAWPVPQGSSTRYCRKNRVTENKSCDIIIIRTHIRVGIIIHQVNSSVEYNRRTAMGYVYIYDVHQENKNTERENTWLDASLVDRPQGEGGAGAGVYPRR